MKKKILVLSMSYYPMPVGGAEVAIKEITDRQNPDDYEFHLICNGYDSTLPKVEKIGNVNVHRIGLKIKNPDVSDLKRIPLHLNKIWYQFGAYYKAKSLHKTHSFDGVWAMMAHAAAVPAGRLKKKFPQISYVLTLQEGDPPEYIERKMRVFGSWFKDGFKQADKLQAISTFLQEWGKKMGFAGESIIIPNAVNTAHFAQTYTEEELISVREEMGLSSNDVVMVTTSRLVHKNAIDDVIKAIALLPEHVHFVVFGTGPDQVMLENLVKEHDVSARVHFRGHIDHAVMPKYLKACDIFIRPSRSEGMGNSFVEAMAAEIPVIATQAGGIADFLFDEVLNPDKTTTGWAVAIDSPEEIKQAVLNIINNPQKVAEVKAAAKKLALAEYDWDLIASRMKNEVFDRL